MFYAGTIQYLEQIFTIVPHITVGKRCRVPSNCASEYNYLPFKNSYSSSCDQAQQPLRIIGLILQRPLKIPNPSRQDYPLFCSFCAIEAILLLAFPRNHLSFPMFSSLAADIMAQQKKCRSATLSIYRYYPISSRHVLQRHRIS